MTRIGGDGNGFIPRSGSGLDLPAFKPRMTVDSSAILDGMSMPGLQPHMTMNERGQDSRLSKRKSTTTINNLKNDYYGKLTHDDALSNVSYSSAEEYNEYSG